MSTTATETTNVATKIARIMQVLPEVEKRDVRFRTSKGGTVTYKAYGIDQVVGALRARMGEHNLSLIPQITDVTRIGNDDYVKLTYTLIDGDSGDEKERTWMQPMSRGGSSDKDMGATISYATKNFLMRTFMISPEGDDDPDFDQTYLGDDKQSTNGNQPAHLTQKTNAKTIQGQPTRARYSDLEAIARDTAVKYLHKVEHDGGSATNPRYKGWFKYQDGDRTDEIYVTLYNEHIQEIINKHHITDWKKTASTFENKTFHLYQPGIITTWDTKMNTPKFDECEDRLSESDSIRKAFFHHFKDVPAGDLKDALQVDDSADYTGTLDDAIKAVQDYLADKAEGDEAKALQDAPEVDEPATSKYIQLDKHQKNKQKSLDNMPPVDGDVVASNP